MIKQLPRPPLACRSLSAGLLATALWLGCGPAVAVTITAPKTTDTASVAKCKNDTYKDCTSNASVSKTSLNGNNADFKAGFDAWNGGNPAGGKWTLGNGGALPGGDFTVSRFFATAGASVGGMSFIVDWSYTGADKSDYLWSQALSLNFKPGDSPNTPPANKSSPALDTDTFNGLTACNNKDVGASWAGTLDLKNYYCGPAYPYQTGERQLGDGPQGPWPNSSFEAYAFVSKIDRSTRVLTLYEGIEYGFVLSATLVPEPEAWVLMLAGLSMLGAVRWAGVRRAAH